MFKIFLPFNKINPTHPDFEARLSGLLAFAKDAGAQSRTRDGFIELFDINKELVLLDHLKLVVAQGGRAVGYPLYIKVKDLEEKTPKGLINGTRKNEDTNRTVRKTRRERMPTNHHAIVLEDGTYAVGATDGVKDYELQHLITLDLLTPGEVKQLLPLNEA